MLLMMLVLGVSNALLSVPYLTNELTVNNAIFAGAVFLYCVFLELRHRGRLGKRPVWPSSSFQSTPLLMSLSAMAGPSEGDEYYRNMLTRARRLLATASALPLSVVSLVEEYCSEGNSCLLIPPPPP